MSKRISFKDFKPKMVIRVVPSRKVRKTNPMCFLMAVINCHLIEGKVNHVFIKIIALKQKEGFYQFKTSESPTQQISNPAEYFKGMKISIVK